MGMTVGNGGLKGDGGEKLEDIGCWMFYSLTHGHVTRYTLVDVISPPPPTPPPPQAVTAPIDSLQINWMPVA